MINWQFSILTNDKKFWVSYVGVGSWIELL